MSSAVTATFAAGCFWGVEKVLYGLEGVIATRVGYTGGTLDNPSYKDVCEGRTGHFEAVEVQFDPERISYPVLLEQFWSLHDPSNARGQGPDVGSQYLSAIFVHSRQQEEQARVSREKLQASGRYRNPLVTKILPASRFWVAEPEHQKYFLR